MPLAAFGRGSAIAAINNTDAFGATSTKPFAKEKLCSTASTILAGGLSKVSFCTQQENTLPMGTLVVLRPIICVQVPGFGIGYMSSLPSRALMRNPIS